uniref:Hamartin n=1 Tax=Biomphalaria glabrata TaxID=6526 RepID=A0A2C9KYW8_BIOGL
MASLGPGGTLQLDQICKLLEAPDTYSEIRGTILDNLKSNTGKESWLTCGLVDYYFNSLSQKTQDILSELRDLQAKVLIEKLTDAIKTSEHRLPALQLVLYLAYKELPWCHMLMDSPIIQSLIKFLKSDNDAAVLMTSLMILVILLPSVPDSIVNHLHTIFEIFGRLATYCSKKPASTSEAYLVHIHVGLYSLFNRLYGMYPCLFLAFLNKFCTAKENIHAYEEIIMPMIERVRLHPRLITGLKDTETSKNRWKDQETQDIVVNCSKFSLDLIEASWEDSPLPFFKSAGKSENYAKKTLTDNSKAAVKDIEDTTPNSCKEGVSTVAMLVPTIDPSYVGESPSVLIGLSTPPSSQRTTPAASFIEPVSSSVGPLDTPELTPRLQTPSHWEDGDKTPQTGFKNIPCSSDGKKAGHLLLTTTPVSHDLNSPNILQSDISSFCSKTSAFGAPTPNPSAAVRSLLFNSPQEDKQEADKRESHFKTAFQDSLKLQPENEDVRKSSDNSNTSFLLDSLPQVISTLITPDTDILDKEVANITEKEDHFETSSPSSSITTMTSQTDVTAESVRQFMKKVNRIRFNSLTSNSSSDYDAVSIPQGIVNLGSHRPRSCPPFKRQLLQPTARGRGSDKKQASAGDNFVSRGYNRQSSMFDQIRQRDGAKNTSYMETSMERQSAQKNCSEYIGNEMCGLPPIPALFNPVIQYIFAPSTLTVCSHCHKQLVVTHSHMACDGTTIVTYKGNEVPLFNTIPPPELLDKHIRLGSDTHKKELTNVPLIAKDSTNWTHFGGHPPADEIKILKNQILMVQNQLMFERHKSVNHDKRNRRLLRRIADVRALEEQQKTLLNQVRLHEETIQNLNVCIKLLEEDNRRMKQMQESDDYERLIQYRLALKENKDLKASNAALKSLLLTQKEDYDKQQKNLENVQHKYLEAEKELQMCKERLGKAEHLKEKVFQLQKEILLMQELYQKCQEKLNFSKTSASYKLEESYLIKSLNAELEVLTKENKKRNNLLEAYQMRTAELEAILKAKETAVIEIKHGFEEIKSVYNEKLKAVEDRCKSMININQLLEGKCMDLLAQLDKATHKMKLEAVTSEPQSRGRTTAPGSGTIKDQVVVKHGRDSPVAQERLSTHSDSSNLSTNVSVPASSSTDCATVVVANEEVSVASSFFSEPNLTPLPRNLINNHRNPDGMSDSGAASRSSYRGDSDGSIHSFITGDSGL